MLNLREKIMLNLEEMTEKEFAAELRKELRQGYGEVLENFHWRRHIACWQLLQSEIKQRPIHLLDNGNFYWIEVPEHLYKELTGKDISKDLTDNHQHGYPRYIHADDPETVAYQMEAGVWFGPVVTEPYIGLKADYRYGDSNSEQEAYYKILHQVESIGLSVDDVDYSDFFDDEESEWKEALLDAEIERVKSETELNEMNEIRDEFKSLMHLVDDVTTKIDIHKGYSIFDTTKFEDKKLDEAYTNLFEAIKNHIDEAMDRPYKRK